MNRPHQPLWHGWGRGNKDGYFRGELVRVAAFTSTLAGGAWNGLRGVPRHTFTCGFCGDRVASAAGWSALRQGTTVQLYIRICPSCDGPSLFTAHNQFPGESPGDPVANLPDELEKLYGEARASAAAGAPTAAVLACRKMLMNIAVKETAKEGLSFVSYVEFLDANGFIPPKGKVWVDYIRKKGNEANHEIQLMTDQDAKALIAFVEMLLKFIYEFPTLVPPAPDR